MDSEIQLATVIIILITTIIISFFCWMFFQLLFSYSSENSTQMEKCATNSDASFKDLPPAYKDIYKL